MHSLQKRFLAAVLSLFTLPGVGHYYLGARRAAVYWIAAFWLSFFAFLVSCTFGGPLVFASGVVLVLATQLGAAIDLLRTRAGLAASWSRTTLVALLALCVATGLKSLVRKYFVESFQMPGNAMYPSLVPGDRVLVYKLSSDLHRGGVVTYRNADGTAFMKRVMALEWDRIEVRDNVVWVNGQSLPQHPSPMTCTIEDHCLLMNETNAGRSYPIALSSRTSSLNPKPEIRVPLAHMFVMGDARRWSLDSRMTGPVPVMSTIGTARFIWWPLSRFGRQP